MLSLATSALALNVGVAPTRSALSVEMSGVARNPGMGKLQAGYLFPEIGRRRNAYLEKNPDAKIISLGIGDTTQPIPSHILAGLNKGVANLGTKDGYAGYGPEQGIGPLRELIAKQLYAGGIVAEDEVFVSDGSKCDIGRLQMMFGSDVTSAVQDPSYPVYVDTSVIFGQTGDFDGDKSQFDKIVYMPCNPSNDFFPDLANTPRADIVYFCSPNNPTGAAATKAQCKQLIDWANEQGSIVVYDAAYAPFVKSDDVPKSIFEIEGSRTCCIEVNSLSKYAGFTGVRLGWTVVPKELKFKDGSSVWGDFNRIMCTAFNGASRIVQAGAIACLEPEGMKEIDTLIDYYMGNAALLRQTMLDMGLKVHGETKHVVSLPKCRTPTFARCPKFNSKKPKKTQNVPFCFLPQGAWRYGRSVRLCRSRGSELVGHVLEDPRGEPDRHHPWRGIRTGRRGIPAPLRLRKPRDVRGGVRASQEVKPRKGARRRVKRHRSVTCKAASMTNTHLTVSPNVHLLSKLYSNSS